MHKNDFDFVNFVVDEIFAEIFDSSGASLGSLTSRRQRE
jgi:hypothetical protein